jgi:uracil-DNA glycosylase
MSKSFPRPTETPHPVEVVYAKYEADPVFVNLRTVARFVHGEGNRTAPKFCFVGEAPGGEEDRVGRPFVGPAGQVFNTLLAGAGITRSEQWVTNLVKYRPVGNDFRLVTAQQYERSVRYLVQEVNAIGPELVVLMGGRALQSVFPSKRINRDRGQILTKGGRRFVPLYHPAVALYSPEKLPVLQADMAGLLAGQGQR